MAQRGALGVARIEGQGFAALGPELLHQAGEEAGPGGERPSVGIRDGDRDMRAGGEPRDQLGLVAVQVVEPVDEDGPLAPGVAVGAKGGDRRGRDRSVVGAAACVSKLV